MRVGIVVTLDINRSTKAASRERQSAGEQTEILLGGHLSTREAYFWTASVGKISWQAVSSCRGKGGTKLVKDSITYRAGAAKSWRSVDRCV